MATEVACRAYHFLKTCRSKSLLREREKKGYYIEQNRKLQNSAELGIHHNYIHDMESLWWILVWTVFVYEKMLDPTYETSAKWVEAQRNSYNILFPGNLCIYGRFPFLKDVNVFEVRIKNISPFLEGYVHIVRYFRDLLLIEYDLMEKDVPAPIYFSGSDAIHKDFLEKLSKREIEKGIVVSIWGRALRKRSVETQSDLQQPNSKKSKTMSKDTTSTGSTDSSTL